jgi:hypothetical protein
MSQIPLLAMSETIHPASSILDAFRAGQQTLIVSGRPLSDLHAENQSGSIRTLRAILLEEARESLGMATIDFNLAMGASLDWSGWSAEARSEFEARLGKENCRRLQAGLAAANDRTRTPFDRAYLLLASLLASLSESEPLPPILFLISFAEDLVPCVEPGARPEPLVQISQTLRMLADDYRLRLHPVLFTLIGVPDELEGRICRSYHHLHLPQPGRDEKLRFMRALERDSRYRGATLDGNLEPDGVANLTARTPNLGLERVYRASVLTGQPITADGLANNKRDEVIRMSAGTLAVLDTERVANRRLVGRTTRKAFNILQTWASGLRRGDPRTPTNIILAGGPSTAKTDLCLKVAQESGTPAYSILSPKGSLVGESERRARILFRTFKDLAPAFGMIDEISEAFPMQRSAHNLDGGASQAVTAEMLNALSDGSRAGKTLILATTNCPWRVGAAMASRMFYLPVLMAVREDYPEILTAVAEDFFGESPLDPSADWLIKAAHQFYDKGASPRVMRTLISGKIAMIGTGSEESVISRAAATCAHQDPRDRMSAEYADLFAIRACSDLELLPWHGDSDYPFPIYLKDLVDPIGSPGVVNSRVPHHPAYGSVQGGSNQTRASGP